MIHTGPYVEKCSRKGVERFVRDEIASGDHVTLLRTVDICQARAVNTVKAHVAGTTESFWEHLEIYLPVAKGYVISSFARVQGLFETWAPVARPGMQAGFEFLQGRVFPFARQLYLDLKATIEQMLV